MDTAATHTLSDSTTTATLYMSMELSEAKWKLAFTIGLGQRARKKTIMAGDRPALEREIARAKGRFGLPPECRVVSCFEAGRDGFWLHRMLEAMGVENVVVDSSSISIDRRRRRAKTDRLDVEQLLAKLIRHADGERRVWSVVHVPSVRDEGARQPQREMETLKRERTRILNRIKGLLASQGVRWRKGRLGLGAAGMRRWDGSELEPELTAQLKREWERLELVEKHRGALVGERRERLCHGQGVVVDQVNKLMRLKAVGENSAWLFSTEMFSWREFRNRRQVGAVMGLTPTPYDSGGQRREQGISKAGSATVRTMAVEIAWMWLRYQPRSELSLWYQRRFGLGSSRLRRIGIVALARKLLIALWRYVAQDEVPEGALLKSR